MQVMQSEPIAFTSDAPEFNVELVWTMSRQTFQALRSRKALLKVEIKSTKSDESIKVLGTHLLDLREAIPRVEAQIDESCIVHAIWRKLKCPDVKPGKSGPSIKTGNMKLKQIIKFLSNYLLDFKIFKIFNMPIALTIEPSEPEANEEEDKTMVDIDEDLKTEVADPVVGIDRESLSPILNHDRGFFAVGLEAYGTHTFLFNIFVCFGRNVTRGKIYSAANIFNVLYRKTFTFILAFPKEIKLSENEYGNFCYDFFGTQITSKEFQFSKMEDFKPERATAKLFTTPEKLIRFLKTKLNHYRFYVVTTDKNIDVAYAEIDLSDLIKESDSDELQDGKLFVKDAILPLNSIVKDGDSPFTSSGRRLAMSDTMTNAPSMGNNICCYAMNTFFDQMNFLGILGVRISVGLKPDVGLSTENLKDEPLREVSLLL